MYEPKIGDLVEITESGKNDSLHPKYKHGSFHEKGFQGIITTIDPNRTSGIGGGISIELDHCKYTGLKYIKFIGATVKETANYPIF